MSICWSIDTHGSPVDALHKFLHGMWTSSGLNGMLAPIDDDQGLTTPRLIVDPGQIDLVNPFKPIMTMNSARLIPNLLERHPEANYAVLLRPCEMRALVEIARLSALQLGKFLTISLDCPGTLPADEYSWRAERKRNASALTSEALQFARQGGINAYRNRSACQACAAPYAQGADLNVHLLGVPVRRQILIEARDEATAERLKLKLITNGEAEARLVAQHKRLVARLAEQHRHTVQRLEQDLVEILPADVDALVEQFSQCEPCHICMDGCPICSVAYPRRGTDGRFLQEDVLHWLVSCAGCGMCEQSCPDHLPLCTIFKYIRKKLNEAETA